MLLLMTHPLGVICATPVVRQICEGDTGKGRNYEGQELLTMSRWTIKASNSVSTTIAVNDTHHSNNLHDPPLAKENYKENLKVDDING